MEYDPLLTCPYNVAHRIRKSRMQFHLMKCNKQHPDANKKTCPFDARHIIDCMEFNHHVQTCPQRESVLHHKYVTSDPIEHKILPIDAEPFPHEENWDDDTEVKSYNPLRQTEERLVVRQLTGATKSERRKFKKNERLRISHLEENSVNHEKEQEKTVTSRAKKEKAKAKTVVDVNSIPDPAELAYKPLRRPKMPHGDPNASTMSMNDSIISQSTSSKNKSTLDSSKKIPSLLPNSTSEHQVDKPSSTNVSFSYAAALSNKNLNQDKTIEMKNNNKENSMENVLKLSKTLEDIELDDEIFIKEQDSLNKELQKLRESQVSQQVSLNSSYASIVNDKKSPRLAANFSILK